MLRLFVLLSIVSALLSAEITLKEIQSKPTSRAKDFLIWQYLKQDISNKQADKAFALSSSYNKRVNWLYKKRTKDPFITYKKSCQKKRNLFNIKDKKCLQFALNPYKTLALNNKQRKQLSKKVESIAFNKLLKIQSEPYKIAAYRQYSPDTILKMFINTTSYHRRKNLNIELDKKFINKLASSNKIHYFIKMVMRDNKLTKLQKSLFKLDSKKLNSQDNFYLALFHLKHKREKSAIKHLKMALNKTKKSRTKNKLNFWLYKITKNKKYLQKTLKSTSIDIYSLYAHDKLKVRVKNYFAKLQTNHKKHKVDITDPFAWDKLREKIKKAPKNRLFSLAKKYKHSNMLPVQSYIYEKAYAFKKHSYIMPYKKYLESISKDEQALVYAIMRQESNFIPSALSRSFALGLMQMMPFLVDAMSKQAKEKITYKDMFKPEVNLRYAVKHIEWIKRSLYHPLFVAYGYNGGVNYFRKHLKTGAFKKGKYEPFLSMELMRNVESREYGKRVLANYVMYKKILGEKVSIIHLFQKLKYPKKNHRY